MRGDGRVFQRGRRWWVQYYVAGEQVREPARLPDKKGVLRPAKDAAQAERFLRTRRAEILGGRFIGPQEDRLTVGAMLDALLVRAEAKGLRSLAKLRAHVKAVREFFSQARAGDVTPEMIGRFKHERLEAGRAAATVNRGLEALRQAYRLAVKQRRLSQQRVPEIEFLHVDNVRSGFFSAAEVSALLPRLPDQDVRDFVAWGFRTGMRKGEAAKLTWAMLDRSSEPWVLRVPGDITKNKAGRSLGLQGEVRTIIERRLKARRFDCPLIFHRVSKGKPGQPVKAFGKLWRQALKDAQLPDDRIFHDLRRSAVRNLIRAGVDPQTAMKVSGHKTPSMLRRYNIIEERETADALAQADAWLSTQPQAPNVERGQFGDNPIAAGAEVLASQQRMAEARGSRTHRPRGQPGAGRL